MLRSNWMIASPAAHGRNGPMAKRRIHDDEFHAQFVTFSCYRRRRSLDHPRARQIVMGVLAAELKKHEGTCRGFVVMPDVEQACDWQWSSARYYEQGKSVGVPLGWVF